MESIGVPCVSVEGQCAYENEQDQILPHIFLALQLRYDRHPITLVITIQTRQSMLLLRVIETSISMSSGHHK